MVDKTQFISFLKRKDVAVVSAGVLGVLAGSGGTYFILEKRLKQKYEAIANDEIEEARERYKVMYKEPLVVTEVEEDDEEDTEPLRIFPDEKLKTEISEFVKEVEEVAEAEGNTPEAVKDTVRNIFRDAKSANSHFDYDEEVPKRTPEKPYIITEEEFMLNEMELEQGSLTYYEGDGVLADERDEIVQDDDTLVGEENLQRWGHGAKDRNMVHIRNEKVGMEWEVLRSTGSFAKEVYGFDDSDNHLEHSAAPRRFRPHRDD